MLQDQMPPAKKGLWEAYREIVPAVIRQAKNPDYKQNSSECSPNLSLKLGTEFLV